MTGRRLCMLSIGDSSTAGPVSVLRNKRAAGTRFRSPGLSPSSTGTARRGEGGGRRESTDSGRISPPAESFGGCIPKSGDRSLYLVQQPNHNRPPAIPAHYPLPLDGRAVPALPCAGGIPRNAPLTPLHPPVVGSDVALCNCDLAHRHRVCASPTPPFEFRRLEFRVSATPATAGTNFPARRFPPKLWAARRSVVRPPAGADV